MLQLGYSIIVNCLHLLAPFSPEMYDMSKPISASPNHASGQRNGTAIIIERLLLLLLSLLLLLQHGVSKLERCRYDVGANDIFRQRCPGPSPRFLLLFPRLATP